MSDHREDIQEAADAHLEYAKEALRDGEEIALDVEVFVSNHDRRRVEFLLTCGGPTVWVSVDEHERVTFHHSWGMDEDGEDCCELDIWGRDAEFWVTLADDFAEMMAEVK